MSGGNPYYFSPVNPGQAITANWANSIIATVNKLATELHMMKTQLNIPLYQRLDTVVELVQDISAGGSANAKILKRDNSTGIWEDAPTAEVKVYDAVGTIEASAGDKFLAKFLKQPGIWVLIGATGDGSGGSSSSSSSGSTGEAKLVTFELTEPLTTDMTSANADVVAFYDGDFASSSIAVVNPTTSIDNVYRYSGGNGAHGEAYFSGQSGIYVIVNMECP